MSGATATFAWGNVSEDFDLFRTLSSEQRLKALNAMVRLDLVRGQMLVAQGGPSDSLFMVLHGALAVCRNGDIEPIAELRAGEIVGEIGFFANVPRTANVIAIRDTSVLALTRAAYQELAKDAPAIVEVLLGALARRFAKETARLTPPRASPRARTVALIDGGREPLLPTPRSSIPPVSTPCFLGERWTHPKSPTGSTNLNTPRRWWFISGRARLLRGRARRSARPT
jgi:NTE family protein